MTIQNFYVFPSFFFSSVFFSKLLTFTLYKYVMGTINSKFFPFLLLRFRTQLFVCAVCVQV